MTTFCCPYIFFNCKTAFGWPKMVCSYVIVTFSFPYALPGKSVIVRFLLSRGAHVDGNSESGTPLHFAALKGHESTVEVLLEHHANVLCLYLFFSVNAA